jgi:ubiquinone/menaquinone biosynthesis C-methylase UbiE
MMGYVRRARAGSPSGRFRRRPKASTVSPMSETQRASAFTDTSLPERYERYLGGPLFEPWAEVLLDAVQPSNGAAVIDIASGTGIAARAAARRVGPSGRVLATDVSPAMIAFNAGHSPLAGAAPIETAVAPVTDLGVRDGTFDVALCQQGMPFFTDRPAAVREMRRVLRPGGVVGIAVWSPGHELAPFGWLNGALADAGVPEPYPNAYDQASYVLSEQDVADLLDGAGFDAVDCHEVELVTRWTDVEAVYRALSGTPFAAALEALDDAARDRVRREIADAAAPFAVDGHLAIPTYAVIARAVA